MLDSRRNIALACALSALAGYVDGIGFLHLGGLFVSFMSGNSTRMGVSLAAGALADRGRSAWADRAVRGRGRRRQPDRARPRRASAALRAAGGGVAAGRCRALPMRSACRMLAVAAIVLAMGLENAVFQIDGGAGLASPMSPARWSRSANSLAWR